MCAELVLHWAVNPAGVIPNCGIVTHHHSHLDASLSERLRALLVIRKTEIRVLQLAPTIYASVSGIGNTPHFQCGFYLRVRVPSDAPRFNASMVECIHSVLKMLRPKGIEGSSPSAGRICYIFSIISIINGRRNFNTNL